MGGWVGGWGSGERWGMGDEGADQTRVRVGGG